MSSPEDPPRGWRSNQENAPTGDDYIVIGRPERVRVPAQDLICVRRQDLERIERLIAAELNPRPDYLQNLAVALIGTAVGVACAIPGLLESKSLPSWVIPVFVVVPIALSLTGLIFVYMDRNLRRTRKDDALSIAGEVRALRGTESHNHVERTGSGAPGE
jgi:hypothetical protein